MMAAADSITLLTPASSTLAVGKTHRRFADGTIKTESYGSAKTWYASIFLFDGFEDYKNIIAETAKYGRHVIIRGRPKDGVDLNQPVFRRIHDDPETKETAQFEAQDTRLCMLDFDNYPNPWGIPECREEGEAIITWLAHETLPSFFLDAKCFYQFSSSMGIDNHDLVKAHLWFLLKEPQADAAMCQWAESNGNIDESVFRAVQPHYLANPKFVDMEDPLGEWRSGVIALGAGHDTVDFHYDMVAPDVWQDRKNAAVVQQQNVWRAAGHQFTMVMPGASSAPMQRIAEIGVGGRLHMPITRSAASWVTHCGLNPDREAWKAQVRERVLLSGHSDARHRSSDLYLNAQWRSALRKYSSKHPDNAGVPRELIVNQNKF